MTASSLHIIWGSLALLQVFLVLTKANDVALQNNNSPELNVTTSLEDYITQNDRQYSTQLASYASQINDFRADYQRQLDTINYNRDLVELRLVETDKKLYPLEMLDDLTKHCVQRYSNLVVTTTSVRSSFLSCTNQALTALNTILATPENTEQLLKNYYRSNWKDGLTDCAKQYSNSYANHTICVTNLTSKTNSFFNSNQLKFILQMETSRCSANTRINETVQCVFPKMADALGSVGKATRLIDDCIADIKLCQSRNDREDNTLIVQGPECPDVVEIPTGMNVFEFTTIPNPLYGKNSTIKCLLLNFVYNE